jgi:hypothetical protein
MDHWLLATFVVFEVLATLTLRQYDISRRRPVVNDVRPHFSGRNTEVIHVVNWDKRVSGQYRSALIRLPLRVGHTFIESATFKFWKEKVCPAYSDETNGSPYEADLPP